MTRFHGIDAIRQFGRTMLRKVDDHHAAQSERERIDRMPGSARAALTRLEARCPSGCLTVVVYESRGRRLIVPTGPQPLRSETPVMDLPDPDMTAADHQPHAARWLDAVSDDRVWTVKCRHGVHQVAASKLATATPASGRVRVGVSSLAPDGVL